MSSIGDWLCRTDQDRARLLDSSERVRRARTVGAAAVGCALLAMVPFFGWWVMGVFVLVAVQLLTLDRRLARAANPALTVAFSLIFTEAAIGAGVAHSGAATSPALPWMAIPIGMTAARFRPGVVQAGLALGAAMTFVAAVVPAPVAAWDKPFLLVATLVLEVNMVAVAAALQGAELQHRSEAVLDPLTGLLNRSSLEPRFAELREQARQSGASLALVALDLDGFKKINDEHGHAVGDVVLRDLSYEMRKALRSFELFYRFGGEEFVVVLPGVEQEQAILIAEHVRQSVERARPGGLRLTVSAGVAGARGDGVEFRHLFEAADDALYDAKRRGRNRVSVAPRRTVPALAGGRQAQLQPA